MKYSFHSCQINNQIFRSGCYDSKSWGCGAYAQALSNPSRNKTFTWTHYMDAFSQGGAVRVLQFKSKFSNSNHSQTEASFWFSQV